MKKSRDSLHAASRLRLMPNARRGVQTRVGPGRFTECWEYDACHFLLGTVYVKWSHVFRERCGLASMRASPDVVDADLTASMVKGMNRTWWDYPTKKDAWQSGEHQENQEKGSSDVFWEMLYALASSYIYIYIFVCVSLSLVRQWPPRARGCQKLGSNLPLPGSRWRLLAWSHEPSMCRHRHGRWLWFRLAFSHIHNSWV